MERHLQNMRALQRELEKIEQRTRELIRKGKRLLAEAEGPPASKPKTAASARPKRKTANRQRR